VDGYIYDGQYLLIAEDGENLRSRSTPIAFLAQGKFWVNNHAHIVRGNYLADTRFLMYILSITDISGYVTGSAIPKLSQSSLNHIPVWLPPIEEQRIISDVLGSLDNKIELNRRTNASLEESARALFKSWFVDFDPVRAKMEGRQPEGIDAETAALFPDRLVESALGLTPEGWRVEPLGEIVEAIKGVSHKGAGLADEGMPLHNLNSIYEGGGYKHAGIKYYSGEYRDRHIVRAGDLIVANTEQGHHKLLIGYPALIPQRYGDRGIFSHHLYKVVPLRGSPVSPIYLYFLLSSTLRMGVAK